MIRHTSAQPFARIAAARIVALGSAIVVATAAVASAQGLKLTLEEAVKMAAAKSEAITIARSAETRAAADFTRARSQRLPQLALRGSYDRTLESEYAGVFTDGGASCSPLTVDSSQSMERRLAELERAAGCGAIGRALNFSDVPFGQENAYRFYFSFSQSIYAGGRISAQEAQAQNSRRAAEINTATSHAALALDVTKAFFDALLSDRLVAIAELAHAQASAAYDQARQSVAAGRQPEFEQLRAEVTRDNQRPLVIRRKAERDVAYLRLRQLLEVAPGTQLELEADLMLDQLPEPLAPDALPGLTASALDTERAHIRQAELTLQARESALSMARGERLPTLNVNSLYGKVGYPTAGMWPQGGDFRTNWTVGATLDVPLFTGRRVAANVRGAQADVDEAEARVKQARELAELEAATARENLSAAEAVWQASAATIQQARRAYEIAELRYREGISTQLELSDARLALQLAEANRALAARDLQVSRAHLTLLPLLPVGSR
ncbi:MAG TPA: TolC family protein [Vicinamibacterales bacterium]|nr:TolC family protein [Vicinamibacterales bacterium]